MKRLNRIAAMLLVIMLAVAAFGNIHVFGTVEETVSYVEDAVFYDGGVTGENTDIDVPFEPVKVLRSISIQTMPAKLTYLKGEELDLTGLVVKASYSNHTSSTVTNYQVSGYDPDVTGEQTVTISLGGKTTSFQVSVYAVGDANGDGKVNGDDATLLLQYAAGWAVTIQPLAADANGDGKVNGDDATLMLQYAAGWAVTLGKQ